MRERDPSVLLAVDDEADMRLLLKLYLASSGLIVETADGGTTALERLELPPDIDLLVLDLRMPDLDGFAVVRAMRASDQYRDLPVIAISAHADDIVVDEILEAGANRFLRKPFTREELLSEIHRVLELA